MALRLHELHPTLVHAPLALLPTAAAFDLAAVLGGNRQLARAALPLWIAGTSGGLLAGLTGLAASQEVRADDKRASDMMLVHGVGNVLITLAAAGVSAWRATHRPTARSVLAGLGACAAAVYTGWLGGQLVYGHGVGIKAMSEQAPAGAAEVPRVFSRQAPGRLLRDAGGGLSWAVRRLSAIATRRESVETRALAGA